MSILTKTYYFFSLLFTITILSGCSDIIEHSPYQAGVKIPAKELNIAAIDSIQKISKQEFAPFTIGLISDSHTWYDQFEEQINHLNQHENIDFAVHLGDLTLSGIYREFIWFHKVSSKLIHPLITVIGNHDYLSNGEVMYQEMFGPLNFTLVYNNCLFVFMDDVIWEKNVEDPDFEWLESVLKGSEKYQYRFLLSHIPPWSDDFSIGNQYYFEMLLNKYKVDLSIHGHNHGYEYREKGKGKTNHLIVPSAKDKEVLFLHIQEKDYTIQRDLL